MPRRYSKDHCRKLAALMRRLNKRLNADPAFRAAASARMKRRRADPAFNAAHRAAMKLINRDPKRKAALRKQMTRCNADPAFRARHLASLSIPARTRAAIIAALRADPNAKRAAARIGGVSYSTVLRIAKAAGITLNRKLTPAQRSDALRRRARGESLSRIARICNVDPSTISRL
jgi:hypothetical protein